MPYSDPKKYYQYFKKRDSKRYLERKQNGLCTMCGKTRDREGSCCSECVRKGSERSKKKRQLCKENKICLTCGIPLDRKGAYCKKCTKGMTHYHNVVYRGKNHKHITDRVKNAKYRTMYKERNRIVYGKERLAVLQIISKLDKPVCVRCGCDYTPVLEMNHKNGGGAQIVKKAGGRAKYMRGIIAGTIPVDELEVTCKICNNLHYCEMKFGVTWEITYKGKIISA